MADTTLPRRITYEDYTYFPDDGRRYEILDGALYVSPAPSPRHQYASRQLQRILVDYFEPQTDLIVFNAPLDVILGEYDVVQPDLVVARRPQISDRGIEGAPELLVEILSPSNISLDRRAKAIRYGFHHVPHYWIVDPMNRTLECFRLTGDGYDFHVSGGDRDHIAIPAFAGLTVALETLWM